MGTGYIRLGGEGERYMEREGRRERRGREEWEEGEKGYMMCIHVTAI